MKTEETPGSWGGREFRIQFWHRLALLLTVTAICCLPARSALADAIVVTKAMTASTVVEISIEESEIVVEMEIGVPDLLAFHPPTAGGDFPTATIGFITYHLGLPAMDFRYLGADSTIDLDWDDSWFSKFRNRNLWRQYDSPLNVFLYVEPYEVRVEIIARPRDVQKWTDVGVGGLKTIPVEIQEEVKQDVADFFAENLDLTIDGDPINPALDRVNFLERTLRTSTVITPPRELDAASATLGVLNVLQSTSRAPR